MIDFHMKVIKQRLFHRYTLIISVLSKIIKSPRKVYKKSTFAKIPLETKHPWKNEVIHVFRKESSTRKLPSDITFSDTRRPPRRRDNPVTLFLVGC
jgi:hypothetical protein